MDITLYHYWRSSASWRVRWALAYKKIPFKTVHVDLLNGEVEGPEHLKRNPIGHVPALGVHGQYFGESLAIIEWLEEVNPSPALLPGEAETRMHIRALAETINAGIQPIQNLVVLDKISEDPKPRMEWAQFFIGRGFEAYEKICLMRKDELAPGEFSVGNHLTMADLCLIPQCYNAIRNEIDLARFPLIKKIYENASKLPSCDASHPDRWKP